MVYVPVQDPQQTSVAQPNPSVQQAYITQQRKYGDWGTNMGGSYLNAPVAFNASSANALESNAQRLAEQQRNYQYGGNAHAANDFVNAVGATQGEAQDQGAALQAQYGGQFGRSASYFGNQSQAVAQRGAGQFLDQRSLADQSYDRGQMGQTYQGLMGAARAPEGPSAAQAQLQLGTNQAMSNQLALARSGRGMGESASALRNAQFQNATIQQNAGNQSAMLRAQEDQAFRGRQLSAYGAAGQVSGQMRQGDLSAGQYATTAQLQTQGLTDQTALGYGNAGLNAQNYGATVGTNLYGMQNQTNLGYYGLQNQVNQTALQGSEAYEGNLTNNLGINVGSAYHTPNTTTPALIAAGGAVLGAVGGTLVAPGPGTVAGAAGGYTAGKAVSS